MKLDSFFSSSYQAHNQARLTHLASLGLPLQKRKVLEVGSGPGDHTGFYVERECSIVSTDGRSDCVNAVRSRFPTVDARVVDLDFPLLLSQLGMFEVVHAYGIFYHLHYPADALAALGAACSDLLLLETCVAQASGTEDPINSTQENLGDPTQATSGIGCRPDRRWLFSELKKSFEHVYQTRTQPLHPEFPIDWTILPQAPLSRVVFVGSRKPLDEKIFSPIILDQQSYD